MIVNDMLKKSRVENCPREESTFDSGDRKVLLSVSLIDLLIRDRHSDLPLRDCIKFCLKDYTTVNSSNLGWLSVRVYREWVTKQKNLKKGIVSMSLLLPDASRYRAIGILLT